jgi:hypothetical protein
MAVAIAVMGLALVSTAHAAGSGCTWLGAVEVEGEMATVMVSVPPDMDEGGAMVALLVPEEDPAIAEVETLSVDEETGLVTLVVAGEAFGAEGEVTITLRKPKNEMIGSAKNADGDAVTPLFTVAPVTPELACHMQKAAGLAGGVPAGIMEALESMKQGFETKSIDKLMSSISEDFTHYQWPDKATYRAFIEGVMMQGELDNAEFDMQYAEFVKNDDGTWTVYPLEVMAMFGSATAELTLKEEDGVWRVIGMEIEGI